MGCAFCVLCVVVYCCVCVVMCCVGAGVGVQCEVRGVRGVCGVCGVVCVCCLCVARLATRKAPRVQVKNVSVCTGKTPAC